MRIKSIKSLYRWRGGIFGVSLLIYCSRAEVGFCLRAEVDPILDTRAAPRGSLSLVAALFCVIFVSSVSLASARVRVLLAGGRCAGCLPESVGSSCRRVHTVAQAAVSRADKSRVER